MKLDLATIGELQKTGKFSQVTRSADEEEHSLEMHLPYIYKMLSKYMPITVQIYGLLMHNLQEF